MSNETYLGDAVYASFDGYQIKLRCAASSEPDSIYLEPQALGNLFEYAKCVMAPRAKQEAANVSNS